MIPVPGDARAPGTGSARALLFASRPKTLAASLAPVTIGGAIAAPDGGLAAGPAAAAPVGGVMDRVGTNFANDIADFERGTDTAERPGPALFSPGLLP